MEIIGDPMNPTNRDYSQFLIIDDDPGIAKFLVTYLRQRGHTCQSLTDGFQTAAWLAHHDCDVVIVDLKMPRGMEFRSFPSSAKLIPKSRSLFSLGSAMTRSRCMPHCAPARTAT